MRDEEAIVGEEAGYYEVALSNRQLIAAFCVFSVVIAGAFLLGVWFAREGQPLGPRPQQSRPAAAAPEVVAAAEGLDELKFFSEERSAAASPARPPAPAAPPAAESRPAPVPPPPTASSTGPAVTPPASRPPNGDVLHVQVFSSPDAAQARRVLDQLRRAGYDAALSPIEVGNRTMHRVRVGPFRDRAEAERIAAQVKDRFRLSTWITAH
jgi:DedD protein